MLTVTQLLDKRLSIKSDYFYKDRIKQIHGATFNPDTKQWIIPLESFYQLENNFAGELVYKTPRWVITNNPMPDMSIMYEISDKSIKAPKLNLNLYDYQDYGVRFMIDKILKRGFVLNADGVGLGKTCQTIGTLKWFIDNKHIKKVLILCKKSIKKQWVDELKKFTDLDKTFLIDYTGSTAAKRKKAYKAFEDADEGILVTNYHSFLNDTALFNSMQIDFVIIDEVHSIKARTGKLNNNIGSIVYGKPTIFLTGTPIMSKPEDIYGIIQMVDHDYFGKWKEFSDTYLTIDPYGRFGSRVVGAKNLNILREKVQDIIIRRTEYEVSIQLPDTIITKVECQMDKTQEELLRAIQASQDDISNKLDALKVNGNIPDFNRDKADQLEAQSKALIAARQAASTDPRMFNMSTSKMMRDNFGKLVPASYKMSSKVEAILDHTEDIMSNGDKVILFTKFRTSALLLKQDIEHVLKENVLMYTGAESEDLRDQAVDLFKNTSTFNILIGTEAMAEGLNLQAARYIINIDQPDTFAIKTQRIGRVRRASSTFNNVTVYDMITMSTSKAISKDEERLANIENNQDLTDGLVNINEAQRIALIQAMKQKEE